MSNYSPATITRCKTILAKHETAMHASKAAMRASKKDAWLAQPATAGQTKRINKAEAALGLKCSPREALGTGADARNLWNCLKADLATAGIRF